MFVLIEGGELFAPEPLGPAAVSPPLERVPVVPESSWKLAPGVS
ncbi:hypothetical protein [Sorangium sp. So ce854]